MTEYLLYLLILIGINTILSTSLNVINGYCGLFSIGHAGFFAVGAYASAYVSVYMFPEWAVSHPYLLLFVASSAGIVAAGIAGLIVGVPCLRLTGDYLAIATVGFAEIIRIVLLNMDVVGASRGLPGIPKLTTVPIVIAAVVFTLVFLHNLKRSSYGRCILSIRENEIAARAMGVDVRFYKTFAFVLASLFAGLGGALFAHFQQFLHPNNFGFMMSVTILLMVVLGGLGSQTGAVFGAIIVTLLPEVLRFNATLSTMRMLIFGIVMVVVMLVMPGGLAKFADKLMKPFKRLREEKA